MWEKAFGEVDRVFGAPYGIFANAGIDEGGLLHEMPLDQWNRILSINLTGTFLTCKYGLRRARLNEEIPLGRIAEPTDPARAALWLLSDESSYVTGSHLVCDGGILAKASISV